MTNRVDRRQGLDEREPANLFSMVIFVLGVLAFGLIAAAASGGYTATFDSATLQALRNPQDRTDPLGPPLIESAVRDITALGSNTVVYLLMAIVCGFLALRSQKKLSLLIFAALVSSSLFNAALKEMVQRDRPDIAMQAVVAYHSSFPSGHTTLSATAYLVMGTLLARSLEERSMRIYVLGVAITLTLLVGMSRIYLGVHWPTDVLAGWILGSVWAILWSTVASRLGLIH